MVLRRSEAPREESLKQQEFYSWLRKIPVDFLRELYLQYQQRKNKSPAQNPPVKNASPTPTESTTRVVILRRSIFILLATILTIEIFFDLIYALLKFFPIILNIPMNIQNRIAPLYVMCFIAFTLLKAICMLVAALGWLTNRYHIGQGEIRYKSGILGHREKIFMCAHTQEVTYSQGFLGRICNFGSIEVFNPALKEKIYIDSIPNPSKYIEVIKKNLPNSTTNAEYLLVQS